MIGWITIKGTGIDYPVMKGDQYLFQNFKKEYSVSGTPFVQDDWTEDCKNTLIYGHNMWVQGTMFNPLHKYEKQKYWEKHKYGKFYVIRKGVSGEKYVECRSFTFTHIIQTSVKDSTWQDYANEKTGVELLDYLDWCKKNHMYDTNMGAYTDDGLVTLCTCSYHISGDRDSGRLLGVGTIMTVNTENQ